MLSTRKITQYEPTPNEMIPAHGPVPIIYMVPPNPNWRADDGTPPRLWIGRGAEVLEGNRGNVRVAGRLANACCQSAAILLFFKSFSCFSCQLCYSCWPCLPMLINAGHNSFHELIYHLRAPASQTGPKSTLRSRNSAC